MSDKDQDGFYAAGDVNSNARGSGARANKGKVSFSLIPFHLLAGTARVFMGGKLKYAEWNWAKGMKWSIAMDCLLRHLFKWWYAGENIDPESGEHHLDHVICNILMLKHYTLMYQDGDDRPSSGLTGFDEWLPDVQTPFDEDAFLKRNPDIAAIIEERKRQEVEDEAIAQEMREADEGLTEETWTQPGIDAVQRENARLGAVMKPIPVEDECWAADSERMRRMGGSDAVRRENARLATVTVAELQTIAKGMRS